MEIIDKQDKKIVLKTDIGVELANAIRRSLNEIPILAIQEVDIYKNDSVLYDEVLAHRMGLIVLKNKKQATEYKLKAKVTGEGREVLAGELGKDVVYEDTPIVWLENGQEVELVAKAKPGKGIHHARHSPGLIYYKHLPKINISGEGEKQLELAEFYPDVFEGGDKLTIKDAWKADFDEQDLESYKGVDVKFDNELVFYIESWGQIKPEEMFIESCNILKSNLNDVKNALK
ncbi:MAG: hypothetical protein ACP5D2_02305 [Candidatus Nanoarchaeia archaeon]